MRYVPPFCLEFSFHFEDEMFLRREDFVTPRPERESTVHDTVGVYKSTKCHIVVFWRLKWEMINLWNPESYKT